MSPEAVRKFRCNYSLDEAVDRDSVDLCQRVYRLIQSSLKAHVDLPLASDGYPEAVPYYMIYCAALIYGAADAATTLVLHNLGREARLFERQIFECWVRAKYYVDNPNEARKAMLATPFAERRILDGLGYEKESPRYKSLIEACDQVIAVEPDAGRYRELSISDILRPHENDDLRRLYTLQYRIPSQMAHGTFAGVGGVLSEAGISFDSRETLPTYTIGTITVYILAFLQILNEVFKLDLEKELAEMEIRRGELQSRMYAARGESTVS
jgi:hypothetical protein